MELSPNRLDTLVLDIIRENSPQHPTREEISQLALDHIKSNISQYIQPSIDRLVRSGQIEDDRDCSRGRPYTYSVPPIKRRF